MAKIGRKPKKKSCSSKAVHDSFWSGGKVVWEVGLNLITKFLPRVIYEASFIMEPPKASKMSKRNARISMGLKFRLKKIVEQSVWALLKKHKIISINATEKKSFRLTPLQSVEFCQKRQILPHILWLQVAAIFSYLSIMVSSRFNIEKMDAT